MGCGAARVDVSGHTATCPPDPILDSAAVGNREIQRAIDGAAEIASYCRARADTCGSIHHWSAHLFENETLAAPG